MIYNVKVKVNVNVNVNVKASKHHAANPLLSVMYMYVSRMPSCQVRGRGH